MDQKLAGNAAFQAGDWTKARALYTQALASRPDMVELLANRAACALRLHDWSAALSDCDAAMAAELSPQLRTKVLWRQAVALRNLGTAPDRWHRAVQEGLALDPANPQLRAEAAYVFVESGVPPEFATTPAPTPPPAAAAVATPPTAHTTTDFLPTLPLTYHGVLQLIRNRSEQAYAFWYREVTGAQLQAALAKPGVEPDVLDYIHAMVVANPAQRQKNAEFLAALAASPRYTTALLMADDSLAARVSQLATE